MKKRIIAVFLAAVMLTGCGVPGEGGNDAKNDSSGSGGDNGKELTFALTTDPFTLDPQLCTTMNEGAVDFHLYEGLYRLDGSEVVPAGAESYDVSEDGLAYTFHLRDGAKWSDGKEVVADDYKYGFERVVDPKVASPGSYLAGWVKNANKIVKGELPLEELGIKVIDDKTIEFQLEYPASYFVGMLSTPALLPARRDIVEEKGKDYGTAPDSAVYNGPFALEKWSKNEGLVLKKNDEYWNAGEIKMDTVNIEIIPDAATQLGMFENGELDYVEIPSEQVSNYPDAETFLTGSVEYLQFNLEEDEIYANKDFRKAVSAAIDRSEYITMAKGGMGSPATRLVLPVLTGTSGTYGEDYPLDLYSENSEPDKAKEFLASAMTELNIANASDITITLLCNDTEASRKSAEVYQEQIKKNLGISVEVEQIAAKQYWSNWAEENFGFMIGGFSPDYSDPYTYLELFISDNSSNHSNYVSEAYDSAMISSQTELDPVKRYEYMVEAEKVVCEDLPIIPVMCAEKSYLINDKLKNFTPCFVAATYNWIHAEIED